MNTLRFRRVKRPVSLSGKFKVIDDHIRHHCGSMNDMRAYLLKENIRYYEVIHNGREGPHHVFHLLITPGLRLPPAGYYKKP